MRIVACQRFRKNKLEIVEKNPLKDFGRNWKERYRAQILELWWVRLRNRNYISEFPKMGHIFIQDAAVENMT